MGFIFLCTQVLLFSVLVECQLRITKENGNRYLVDQPFAFDDQKYYKPAFINNRRSDHSIQPAQHNPIKKTHQDEELDDANLDGYSRAHSLNDNNDRFQLSHKDYEQILRHNHRLRSMAAFVASTALRKQQSQRQPKTSQLQLPQHHQQYLKEVNPSTIVTDSSSTLDTYQRPTNYLRFSEQDDQNLKNGDDEEGRNKPIRYVLQVVPQQSKNPQYSQFLQREEPPKSRTQPFNLVAYQNALITRQKLLAGIDVLGESTEDGESELEDEPKPKSSIYVSQNIPRTNNLERKIKTGKVTPTPRNQFENHQQPDQEQLFRLYQQEDQNQYRQPFNTKPVKAISYKLEIEDPNLNNGQVSNVEYRTQPSLVRQQQSIALTQKVKNYIQQQQINDDYQLQSQQHTPRNKQHFQYEYQVNQQSRGQYNRIPQAELRYSTLYDSQKENDTADALEYQQHLPRRQPRPQIEEVQPPKLYKKEHFEYEDQEESRHRPHRYQPVTIAYQPSSSEVIAKTYKGPGVSYRTKLQNANVRYFGGNTPLAISLLEQIN